MILIKLISCNCISGCMYFPCEPLVYQSWYLQDLVIGDHPRIDFNRHQLVTC